MRSAIETFGRFGAFLIVFAYDFVDQRTAAATIASRTAGLGALTAVERPFPQSAPEVSISDSLAVTNDHWLRFQC